MEPASYGHKVFESAPLRQLAEADPLMMWDGAMYS